MFKMKQNLLNSSTKNCSITTSTSRAGFHFRENVEIILSKFIDSASLKKMLPVKLVSFQRRPKIYSAIFYFELVRSVRFDLMGLNHSGFFNIAALGTVGNSRCR